MKKVDATPTNQSSAKTDTGSLSQQPKRAPYKIEMCSMELLRRGLNGLVELEALTAFGTTCLHSDISTLYNKHGVIFKREPEPHQHIYGGSVTFTRYTPASLGDAQKLLAIANRCRIKRRLSPLPEQQVNKLLEPFKADSGDR